MLVPTAVRGGYVADEVGMGKTLCALSLILANPAPPASSINPMLADANRITVWYIDEATPSAPAKPSLAVVLWSNLHGMHARFDNGEEFWVDAREDDWAWGDHPPKADSERPVSWIQRCKNEFVRMQEYSDQVVWLRATLVIVPVSLHTRAHAQIYTHTHARAHTHRSRC